MGPEQRPTDREPDLDRFPDLVTAIPGSFESHDYFDLASGRKQELSHEEEPSKQRDRQEDYVQRPPFIIRKPRGQPTDSSSLATRSADVYARACNLLREAMGADGVIFVNAKVPSLRRPSTGGDSDNAARRSETEGSDYAVESAAMAELLAFSTRERGSVGGYPVESYDLDLPERLLQRLLRRHPGGLVYHLDESGEIGLSSDDRTTGPSSNEENNSNESRRRNSDEKTFGRIAKDARTVAFYPIWDDSLERCRSCVLAWGVSKDRCGLWQSRCRKSVQLTLLQNSTAAKI